MNMIEPRKSQVTMEPGEILRRTEAFVGNVSRRERRGKREDAEGCHDSSASSPFSLRPLREMQFRSVWIAHER
jgi:hypothetical protein